jgi:glycosyltransferase involved in cell wall biosynthesis
MRRSRAGAVRSTRDDDETPALVERAVADFYRENGDARLAPIVVVIPALNEEASIGSVVDEVPGTICDLAVDVLVIDDGGTDATGARAREHGALVCRFAKNRGQGTAFRTGYRLAREGAARYVATLDGDGQWNPADLPAMVALLVNDRADFALGSRQLGATENTDSTRNAGVRFFSRVISLATGTRVTDSSSGLRVMRVEVTERVRQTQPQYQSSELLIGAIMRGFRVAEIPTVMRVRNAGESKKGRNGLYAVRYSEVVARTLLREWRDRILRRVRR